MRTGISTPNNSFSPKAIIQLIMIIGLAAFTIAIIQQKLLLAWGIAALPITLGIFGYGLLKPHFIYCLYATYSFSFIAIMRYSHTNQLSALLDALVFYALMSIVCSAYHHRVTIWHKAVNMLTLSYVIWIGYTLLQFTNPNTDSDGLNFGLRYWIVGTILLYIMLSVLSDSFRVLKIGLGLISFFLLICFIKLLIQRYIGFDGAERYFLYDQGAKSTHILGSGIRYFSFLSDAATFGTFMGMGVFVYSITSLHASNRILRLYFLSIALISVFGLLLSGTRGAIVIPLSGLLLYTLLCKNFKTFFTTILLGATIFVFFAFTDIGKDNQFIRRARTAFRPSKDASMNVRLVNRELIAEYISHNPMGAGLANQVPIVSLDDEGNYVQGVIPSDSYFVWIWSQTGYAGLFIFLGIHCAVLLQCCYNVLFKVKNRQLQQILAAFTCTVFGVWVSGYTSYSPGQPPINFLVPAMIAFVMNGAYIDKQLCSQKQLEILKQTNNAI